MPKEPEEIKLRKGCNLLIASPGRLLDHLKHTSGFNFHVTNSFLLFIFSVRSLNNELREEL